MNIMKTSMLSIDNKIKKEEAGIPAVQMPAVSKAQSNIGMKALMFQGMQNLMANPMLAKETGVMNDEPQADNKDAAKSYVAPYSSNIAFQGKFANATKIAALAAMLTLGAASCTKENFHQEQTQIVDLESVTLAINELRKEMSEYNAAQSARDKEVLAALNSALQALFQIQASIQNQTLTIEQFQELVLGKMDNGEFQRAAILDAIMVLQQITEDSAKEAVNKILQAYQQGRIDFQTAMSQIQDLLKENNSLLKSVLAEIKSAKASADAYAKSLLAVAQEIDKNGKASLSQHIPPRTQAEAGTSAAP